MNKKEFLRAIAEKSAMSQEAADVFLHAMVEAIQEALTAGSEVTLPGLGKFEVTTRTARPGRNPRTGEAIVIAAKQQPQFKAALGLKTALNVKTLG